MISACVGTIEPKYLFGGNKKRGSLLVCPPRLHDFVFSRPLSKLWQIALNPRFLTVLCFERQGRDATSEGSKAPRRCRDAGCTSPRTMGWWALRGVGGDWEARPCAGLRGEQRRLGRRSVVRRLCTERVAGVGRGVCEFAGWTTAGWRVRDTGVRVLGVIGWDEVAAAPVFRLKWTCPQPAVQKPEQFQHPVVRCDVVSRPIASPVVQQAVLHWFPALDADPRELARSDARRTLAAHSSITMQRPLCPGRGE
eukprot:5781919-Prymnesium_polylepis.2